MAEEKILVVDDEVGMVTLLRNYLTREGYDVTTAPVLKQPCTYSKSTRLRPY